MFKKKSETNVLLKVPNAGWGRWLFFHIPELKTCWRPMSCSFLMRSNCTQRLISSPLLLWSGIMKIIFLERPEDWPACQLFITAIVVSAIVLQNCLQIAISSLDVATNKLPIAIQVMVVILKALHCMSQVILGGSSFYNGFYLFHQKCAVMVLTLWYSIP